MKLVRFPLLMDSSSKYNYTACTIPWRLPSDDPPHLTSTEISWVNLLRSGIPSYKYVTLSLSLFLKTIVCASVFFIHNNYLYSFCFFIKTTPGRKMGLVQFFLLIKKIDFFNVWFTIFFLRLISALYTLLTAMAYLTHFNPERQEYSVPILFHFKSTAVISALN